MTSKRQKIALMSCLTLSMAACSSITPQTPPPTTTVQKQITPVYLVNTQGIGARIGTIQFQQTDNGLLITPTLEQLSPGEHGFHIHENASCAAAEKDGNSVAALAAGGHLNPENVTHHGTPENGHLGDLPALLVNAQGVATTPVLAPRLKLADIQGRAIMVHAGGDNYSDTPKPLGGGGARIACGVIQ